MVAHDEAIKLTQEIAQAAADKLAQDIVIIDVSDELTVTDCFVLTSAKNERQVSAIVDGIERHLLTLGIKATRREGNREGRWVLLDYIDVVVHVQHEEERQFYGLDRLWHDCARIPWEDENMQSRESVLEDVIPHLTHIHSENTEL